MLGEGEHEGCLSGANGTGEVSTRMETDLSSGVAHVQLVSSFGLTSSKVAYPPIPMVNDLSSQSLFSMIGISRPRKLPGPSRIS